MSWCPISHLLCGDADPRRPIALRAGVLIDLSRLRADVAGATARLAGHQAAALACEDTYYFTVGLLALLHCGADIVLPPNTRPDTLATLSVPLVTQAMLEQAETAPTRFHPLSPEQSKIIFATSGSTGAPKQIAKTLGMLTREAEVLQHTWGARMGAGPVLATVSHQHLYGLAFRLLWPLAGGCPIAAETDAVWETLLPKLHPGVTLISSPAHLSRLAGIPPLAPARHPALIFSAGAPLSAAAARDCQTILGCLPTEIFGSTETGAIATRRQTPKDTPKDTQEEKSWTLLAGTHIRLDTEGRMAVASSYKAGWQATEDVVEVTENGFRFLGRADRIVKIEGERVNLPALEAALAANPVIAEAALVVLPGPPAQLGGLLVLTALGQQQLHEQGRFKLGRALRADLARHFAPAGLPRLWRFTSAIPMRAMGKRADAEMIALFDGPQA